MIKQVEKNIVDLLAALPNDLKVLDVGGASGPLARADHMIDIVPFEQIHWEHIRGGQAARFGAQSYTQFDICGRQPWPFADKSFDFSICSHVLEDIRDPLWVCSELIRVSKAGYIEVPSRLYECTFNLEAKGLAGAAHHRWVIDMHQGQLRFTFKYFYIHKREVNRQRQNFSRGPKAVLGVEWENSFDYFENWLNSGKEIFEFYLGRQILEKEKWQLFRKVQAKNVFRRWGAYLKNTSPLARKLLKIKK